MNEKQFCQRNRLELIITFNMAAGRHLGLTYFIILKKQIVRFFSNLVHILILELAKLILRISLASCLPAADLSSYY